MAWTNPRTVAYNDAFPANQWNNEVRDNLNYLKDRIDHGHGTTFPSSPATGDQFNVVTSHFVLPMIYDGTRWVSQLWATKDLLPPLGAPPLNVRVYRDPHRVELSQFTEEDAGGFYLNGETFTVDDYLAAGLTLQIKLEFDSNDGLGTGVDPRAGDTMVQAGFKNDTRAAPGIHPAFEADSSPFPTAISGSESRSYSHGHVVGPWTSVALPSDAFSVRFSAIAWLVNTSFSTDWNVNFYGAKVELRWIKTP